MIEITTNTKWKSFQPMGLLTNKNICEYCHQKKAPLKMPSQGISCVHCGSALCDDCFQESESILGTLGDMNSLLPQEEPPEFAWPYFFYYPEQSGVFGTLRMCINCYDLGELQMAVEEKEKLKGKMDLLTTFHIQ